jgi:hypothetical protein
MFLGESLGTARGLVSREPARRRRTRRPSPRSTRSATDPPPTMFAVASARDGSQQLSSSTSRAGAPLRSRPGGGAVARNRPAGAELRRRRGVVAGVARDERVRQTRRRPQSRSPAGRGVVEHGASILGTRGLAEHDVLRRAHAWQQGLNRTRMFQRCATHVTSVPDARSSVSCCLPRAVRETQHREVHRVRTGRGLQQRPLSDALGQASASYSPAVTTAD